MKFNFFFFKYSTDLSSNIKIVLLLTVNKYLQVKFKIECLMYVMTLKNPILLNLFIPADQYLSNDCMLYVRNCRKFPF
jgi:hypothetical protein